MSRNSYLIISYLQFPISYLNQFPTSTYAPTHLILGTALPPQAPVSYVVVRISYLVSPVSVFRVLCLLSPSRPVFFGAVSCLLSRVSISCLCPGSRVPCSVSLVPCLRSRASCLVVSRILCRVLGLASRVLRLLSCLVSRVSCPQSPV